MEGEPVFYCWKHNSRLYRGDAKYFGWWYCLCGCYGLLENLRYLGREKQYATFC